MSRPNRKKGILIGFIIVALGLLAVVIVAISSSKKPAAEPNFVWIDPTQFARQIRPGRLKRLYYKVVNFTAPVWRHFTRPKTQILIDSKILAVHGLSTGNFGVGAAMATNQTGTQIWILSPSELNDLRKRLKTAHGIDVVNAPRLIDSDGETASIFVGESLPQTSASSGAMASANSWKWISVGVTIDVIPKIADHQLQLAMNALYTEQNDSPTIPLRTNLSAAFRVKLSNAGGVLICSPLPRAPNGTNCWLILSSTAIDGFGKPIKL